MEHVKNPDLRREIRFLGKILGDTIRQLCGDESFLIVEDLRRLAWDRRTGRENAEREMTDRIAALDDQHVRIVIRAFSVFLDLLNVVEDRRRVRVLRQRAAEVYPEPRGESIEHAVSQLKEFGKSADEMQSLVDHLQIELVFTAHPTDAKRRSVRSKLTAIRSLMNRLDGESLPQQRDRVEQLIRGEIAKLWQTDFIRPWRPTVMQEVGRGLSIKPVLWDEVPRIAAELVDALDSYYHGEVISKRPCLTFGSWIGGDRDGHPGVTADITEETIAWLRREAIGFHLRTCVQLKDSLSISQRQTQLSAGLEDALTRVTSEYPTLADRLSGLPPDELCRRWLSVIQWRLEQTQRLSFDSEQNIEGSYQSASQLAGDLETLSSAILESPGGEYVIGDLRAWQSQIDTFGFHLARLDVRQNAKVYATVMNEILQQTGICETAEALDETGRRKLIEESIESSWPIDENRLSEIARETLAMFRTLHRATGIFSPSSIGAHVISMTAAASDVLTVLWLWQQSKAPRSAETAVGPPIVPLLETIGDLQRGPAILSDMLESPIYREYLRQQGDRQIIMLGYSDSTKDGGYLSACWSLYRAQLDLVELANRHGVELTFFHGRGGSLGRGGGPAARSILSLPHGTFRGSLRLTEQGEVLADRYDDPAIAHRHLEQVVWSSLLAAGNPMPSPSQEWIAIMDEVSQASFQSYRELLEGNDFVEFFRSATPISEIEQLPIGSRPSRRKPGGGLSDLRAIPWVFSWTQSRCLLPAWFGLGAAMSAMIDNPERLKTLGSMYQNWPFFRALIDNAELALAKSDQGIASHYAGLASEKPSHAQIADRIAAEYEQCRRVVLALTRRDDLLDETPWLKESIRVRNRFIDPLNLIQVLLLRRVQSYAQDEVPIELRHLTRLSINGIAAGMRTSG